MTSEETRFDPRQRRLCPDGTCVGLIGDNNRCKICGTPAAGSAPAGPSAAGNADDDADTWDGTDDSNGGGKDDGNDDASLPRTLGDVARLEADASGGGFDPKRRLCSDGECLGLIGADNRCNVCGNPGE